MRFDIQSAQGDPGMSGFGPITWVASASVSFDGRESASFDQVGFLLKLWPAVCCFT
jgi:hypothetical protein